MRPAIWQSVNPLVGDLAKNGAGNGRAWVRSISLIWVLLSRKKGGSGDLGVRQDGYFDQWAKETLLKDGRKSGWNRKRATRSCLGG